MLALLIAGVTVAACWGWGPTQYITGPYVYGTDSAGMRTAIAVTYVEQKAPKGILAFPDGGMPRVLATGMLVYACDARSAPMQSLGFVAQGDDDTNVDVRVLTWQANGFDVAFRHYVRQPIQFSAVHIVLTGGTSPLGAPADTTEASQAISPVCKRTLDSLVQAGLQRGANNFYERP